VPARAGEHEAQSTHGEDVQDLVRRVQQGAAERSREAAAAAPRRAPSTVDLPPGSTAKRRRVRRSAQHVTVKSVSSPERRVRRWVVAAMVGAAATAILLDLLWFPNGTRDGPPRTRQPPAANAFTIDTNGQVG
jgi:hypothetical protein